MIMKIMVIALLIVILYCLTSAAIAMIRFRSQPEHMVKALAWRIALSLLLFVLLIVGFIMGWIKPHALTPIPHTTSSIQHAPTPPTENRR